MTWDCLKCGHENEEELPMFGDAAVCEKCGAEHETDWELIDPMEGIMASWVVGLIEKARPEVEEVKRDDDE